MTSAIQSSPSQLTPESMRERHRVRLLKRQEEGFSVANLPDGIYGFAYAPGQEEVPLFAANSYHSFEIHKVAGGDVYVLGFVTPEQERALTTGQEGAEIALYPVAWESSQILVRVLLLGVISARKLLRREDGNPFHFTLAAR